MSTCSAIFIYSEQKIIASKVFDADFNHLEKSPEHHFIKLALDSLQNYTYKNTAENLSYHVVSIMNYSTLIVLKGSMIVFIALKDTSDYSIGTMLYFSSKVVDIFNLANCSFYLNQVNKNNNLMVHFEALGQAILSIIIPFGEPLIFNVFEFYQNFNFFDSFLIYPVSKPILRFIIKDNLKLYLQRNNSTSAITSNVSISGDFLSMYHGINSNLFLKFEIKLPNDSTYLFDPMINVIKKDQEKKVFLEIPIPHATNVVNPEAILKRRISKNVFDVDLPIGQFVKSLDEPFINGNFLVEESNSDFESVVRVNLEISSTLSNIFQNFQNVSNKSPESFCITIPLNDYGTIRKVEKNSHSVGEIKVEKKNNSLLWILSGAIDFSKMINLAVKLTFNRKQNSSENLKLRKSSSSSSLRSLSTFDFNQQNLQSIYQRNKRNLDRNCFINLELSGQFRLSNFYIIPESIQIVDDNDNTLTNFQLQIVESSIFEEVKLFNDDGDSRII
eukprot:TRINITY_DN912_c0_g1_i1.p1 TRINITY_DN912_c0_g1~~TRINITY_DN912_c0_g1_i1.p1  ORF type:complete len:513 (+),score=129.04 TRINITY_DN912_c0_g1_i1:38-1540(+)